MNRKAGGSKDSGKRGNFSKKPRRGDGKPEQPGRPARPARGPRPEQREDPQRPARTGRPDQTGKPERPGRPARPARTGGPDQSERPERPERPGRPARPVRTARSGREDGKFHKSGAPATDRKEGAQRPLRSSQNDCLSRRQDVKALDGNDLEQTSSEDERLVIKGRHEVVQALESTQNIEAVVISTSVKGPVGGQVRELAVARHVPVKEMNPDLFERKFGAKSQGIVALGGAFEYCSLEDMVARLQPGCRILVALNHVEDPRNLGAIVRTVEASGCGGVLIPKHRAAGMTEWAMRTAQGAASHLPVARVNNMGSALEQLKEMGFWVVGLDGKSEKKYNEVMYNNDVVLVAGGEDAGLGERIQRVCDDLVKIPLSGKTPSLNVSVSTGVVLYEILRQKQFFQK